MDIVDLTPVEKIINVYGCTFKLRAINQEYLKEAEDRLLKDLNDKYSNITLLYAPEATRYCLDNNIIVNEPLIII